ncbi:MAG TPA: efflux RND transporter permease subunit [Solirubrobacterales bacterium]|nr:efflux RND transporter permease subunit [Solirubrobacterales bacterium]
MGRSEGRGKKRPGGDGARRPRSWLLRHPREILLVAAIVLATLAVFGTGVDARLDPTTLDVPGSASAEANAMLEEHFGPSAPFAILLRGPAAALDEQGPRLVHALREEPSVTTLSPWDKGSVEGLRPTPEKALVLADFHVDTKTAVDETVPHLEELLEEKVSAPVRVTQSGFATLSRALQQESIDAAEHDELIALPILLIVLLLVFRSPVAAAIPLGFGAVTVLASRGVLYFLTGWFSIDAFALTVCTMIGLALGVDYALLMVSRFREELATGAEPVEAARRTRRHAGRTVAFAGSTLLLSMLVSLLILPGSLLVSLAGTVAMVVVLSVTVATVVGPAILALVGDGVNRWRLGKPQSAERSAVMRFVNGALRRPLVAACVIGAILLALAAPAVGLKLGPPSPEQLAKDAPARLNAELIDDAIGPGWDAPFQVIATNPEGPITDPGSMAALEHFQHRVAHMPGVKVVIGPQAATRRVEPLQELGNSVLASRGNIGPVKELARLGKELNVAAGGVAALREGIAEAGNGAGLLALGSEHATEGAALIASGLARAAGGSGRAIDALERFAKGSEELTEGLLQAEIGAIQLRVTGINSITNALNYNGRRLQRKQLRALRADENETLPRLLAPTEASVEKLRAAEAKLKEAAPGDPGAAAALESVQGALAAITGTDPVTGQPYAEGYAGLVAELEGLQERLGKNAELNRETTSYIHSTIHELHRVGRGAGHLIEGLQKLHKGANTLSHGADKLAKEASRLAGGIEKLSGGAAQLVSGLGRLSGGAEALEANLAAGATKVEPLQSGLTEASVKVLEGHARIRRQAGEVQDQTPGLFNSGYFVLSALDGAPPGPREKAAQTIDLNKGGQAASMLVISKYEFNSPGSVELNERLDAAAGELGQSASLETGVAGGAAQLNDYSHITRERIPWIIAVITLVTFLVLVVVLRALPLAAIAVGLNLLTVGVAFGVLTLLFHVPEDWPLGGHSYVDAVGACMIFAVVFGLSIDYAVFLLTRMRERHDAGDDNATAVHYGLEKTARVITGAAVIMLAVFVVFAGAPIATVSQLGVGLTVAVVLDATVVRIVLLPALMLLLGDRVWWLPRPLARMMPRLSV